VGECGNDKELLGGGAYKISIMVGKDNKKAKDHHKERSYNENMGRGKNPMREIESKNEYT